MNACITTDVPMYISLALIPLHCLLVWYPDISVLSADMVV